MKRRWQMVLFLAVLLCVLFTQSGRRAFPVQTRVLPDGSLLKLVNVTHGKHHRHIEASTGMQWLYAILPRSLRNLPPDRYGELDTPTDQSVAWIQYKPSAAPGNRRLLTNWTLFDEHGCEVILGPQTWPIGFGSGDADPMLIPAPLTPFTHRCRTLGIRFWETRVNAAPKAAAEFQVLTRDVEAADVPEPGPLPASATVRDMRCNLKTFETGYDRLFGSPWPLHGPSDVITRAVVSLTRGSEALRDWEPCGLRLVNSSGEVLDPRPHVMSDAKPQGTELSFFGSVWPHEPAYDVEVFVCKNADAQFSNEDLRTVELTVPERDSKVSQYANPRRFTIRGKSVDVFDPVWGNFGPPMLDIPFDLRPQPTPDLRIVLVKVVDDRGRLLRSPPGWRERYLHFNQPGVESTLVTAHTSIERPTRRIRVTFAVTRPESVRFRVKPTRWKPPTKLALR